MLPLKEDQFYMLFADANQSDELNRQVSLTYSDQFQDFVTPGWEKSVEPAKGLIVFGKIRLAQGLIALGNSFQDASIIFYEVSAETNFTFREPAVSLKTLH